MFREKAVIDERKRKQLERACVIQARARRKIRNYAHFGRLKKDTFRISRRTTDVLAVSIRDDEFGEKQRAVGGTGRRKMGATARKRPRGERCPGEGGTGIRERVHNAGVRRTRIMPSLVGACNVHALPTTTAPAPAPAYGLAVPMYL